MHKTVVLICSFVWVSLHLASLLFLRSDLYSAELRGDFNAEVDFHWLSPKSLL